VFAASSDGRAPDVHGLRIALELKYTAVYQREYLPLLTWVFGGTIAVSLRGILLRGVACSVAAIVVGPRGSRGLPHDFPSEFEAGFCVRLYVRRSSDRMSLGPPRILRWVYLCVSSWVGYLTLALYKEAHSSYSDSCRSLWL
jgi:hypothetical protein